MDNLDVWPLSVETLLEGDLVRVLVRYNLRAIKWLKLLERREPQSDAQLAV